MDSFDRLTVPEAAARLGLSESAIYKRIQRGSFKHETERDDDGRLWIVLPRLDDDQDVSEPTPAQEAQAETLSELRARVDSLEKELDRVWSILQSEQAARREEVAQHQTMIRELNRSLYEALAKLPSLPAGDETTGDTDQDIVDSNPSAINRKWWKLW